MYLKDTDWFEAAKEEGLQVVMSCKVGGTVSYLLFRKVKLVPEVELVDLGNASLEVLRELAKQAAAYTGLPPQYLSSSQDNPASAEAIRASESRMIKAVENKTRIFGSAWEQAMRVAWKIINPDEQLPTEYFSMESVWRDPATPTYAAKADAAVKLWANGTGLLPRRQARLDLGYTLSQIEKMEMWDAEDDPFRGMAQGIVSAPADNLLI
jgi:hypothetical protein